MNAEARTLMDADEAVAAREGRELVRALYLALKATQLYPDDAHPAFVRPLEALAKAIGVSLERRGPFPVILVGDYVFVAGRRLRFDAEGFLYVSHLAEVFRQCGIGGIRMVASPTREALSRVLRLLQTVPSGTAPGQTAPPGGGPGAAILGAALKERGIAALEFLPVQDSRAGTEISLVQGQEAAGPTSRGSLLPESSSPRHRPSSQWIFCAPSEPSSAWPTSFSGKSQPSWP